MNKQELIKEYESIVKDDSLDLCGCYNMGDKIFMRKIYKSVLEDLEQLDEPQKIKLKDVIARIKKLDLGTQKVWLNEILNELGSDYGTLKYKAGYEQGKVEGALIHCEEPQKITVPQFVADWYEKNKNNFEENIYDCIVGWGIHSNEIREWIRETKSFQTLVNMHQFGYTVEKKKRYIVKVKGISAVNGCLKCDVDNSKWFFSGPEESYRYRAKHTIKELDKAGFGWVFDCPGVEVEEVEE